MEPEFYLRIGADGSKLLTFETPVDYPPRALSNACGEWGPWKLGDTALGTKVGHPTRRQAVELVGEDPVRWLEKGAEE